MTFLETEDSHVHMRIEKDRIEEIRILSHEVHTYSTPLFVCKHSVLHGDDTPEFGNANVINV